MDVTNTIYQNLKGVTLKMEGNYLFTKWTKEKGYPNSYEQLSIDNPFLSTEQLDEKWDDILTEYSDYCFAPKSGVITPKSFGPHLKKG